MRAFDRRTDAMLCTRGEGIVIVRLETIEGSDPGLRKALTDAALPVEDLEGDGRSFFRAVGAGGKTLGYAGIEHCAGAALLRSVVVLPEARGQGIGKSVTDATLRRLDPGMAAYLATTSAASFFASLGFAVVNRTEVPASILSTRQLSDICPASATIMMLNKPPT
ncbi:arsenic resistance N-acetyltransferase ArsN2 [Rhizobium sp. TRM96647]|uniref:arsenic resistance N-acetyltransferase ArsN2 n=1 Tax=unclassified Rhizobium TaxID=2613769 RepID=UPI0021E77247|nr:MULTISPECIES: arsenic resistance N-acetyltransferase ArsN2 [unclassified Rhizobium]MCV3739354.1 arsenic resistance N-acetyltransferase ArsN2 [Rhizobium sp. TRM96647]MCV3761020.1 arsenic resistance N-acetyltransferase ArsN2 [Rhizobium sp. TRM96650]